MAKTSFYYIVCKKNWTHLYIKLFHEFNDWYVVTLFVTIITVCVAIIIFIAVANVVSACSTNSNDSNNDTDNNKHPGN